MVLYGWGKILVCWGVFGGGGGGGLVIGISYTLAWEMLYSIQELSSQENVVFLTQKATARYTCVR